MLTTNGVDYLSIQCHISHFEILDDQNVTNSQFLLYWYSKVNTPLIKRSYQ